MRLLAAGKRPISNVVDASNYVMLELGKPIHTFDAAAVHDGRIIVRRAAPGERLETLDHVDRELDPETLLIADAAGPLGDRRGHGRRRVARSATRPRDVVVESAIFDPVSIRRTGVPLRAPVRGQPALREGPGVPAGAARRRSDGAADRRVGGRRRSRRARSTRTRTSRRAAASPSARRASIGCSARTSRPTSSATLLARVGIETAPAGPGTRVRIAAGTDPVDVEPGDAEAVDATVPTLAARPRGRGRPRRGGRPRPRLRARPGHPAGHADAALPPRSARAARHASARRSPGAGLTEAVTYALVSPRHRRALPGPRRRSTRRRPEQSAAGRPITVTNPLSSQHSVLRQSLIGSLLEVVSTNLRHGRDDVAIFEVGKGYGAPGRRADARVVAARPRADRRRRAAGLEPAAARLRPRRREGRARADLPSARLRAADVHAARPTTRSSIPGRAARGPGRRRPRRPARRAPSRVVAALDLRAERIVVAELAVAGLAGGQPADYRGRRPARFPSVERDLAVIVAGRDAGGRGRGGHPPAWRAAPARRRAVRHLPRPAAGRRPTRAWPTGCAARRRADADRRGARRGGRRGHRGPRGRLGARFRT